MKKFLFTTDLHFGYERKGGHKVPFHDEKAWTCMIKFAQDFKPDIWIHGGDMLDVGCLSHHNKGKPGQTEGLRLLADATEGRKLFIDPVEQICKGDKIYITGNHSAWLGKFTDEFPALEGIIDLKHLLKLKDRWKIVPQGGVYSLGKLTFMHGDTISGGEHVAKNAVTNYERSVRFGHFHTYQVFTKTSPIDYKNAKTGISVPCFCVKQPGYGKSKPNKWVQGFDYGYVQPDGTYNDYVVTILDGKATINGKAYKG